MFIRTHVVRCLAVTALAATALLPAAAATAATPGIEVHAGRLVFAPVDRGYQGTIPITITNHTSETVTPELSFVEPVAGAITNIVPNAPCLFGDLNEGRRAENCLLDSVQPGATARVLVDVQALIAHRGYAMSGPEVALTLTDILGGATASDRIPTLFRSTTGSLRHPRPYVQDTRSDIAVTSGAGVTLDRQADGSLVGRIPVTIRYGGDAPNTDLLLSAGLPAGVRLFGTEPSAVCLDSCEIPRFAAGETRSLTVVLSAPAGTPAGVLGTGTFTVADNWVTPVDDIDPSDNVVSFGVTAS